MENQPDPLLNNSHSVTPRKNPFKITTAVLGIIVSGLVAVLTFVILHQPNESKNESSATSYVVDLTPQALATTLENQTAPEDGVSTLSIKDLSDSFANKNISIAEWGLNIKTKYADLLEYTYEKRDATWAVGSTPYAVCNGEYLFCDSIVQVKIKDEYLKSVKDSGGQEVRPTDRTIAYIFQDNRSLSQAGETKARYWSNEAFTTEFGTQGTLVFEQATPAGIDELGRANCPAELTVSFGNDIPCEDIFMSIYKFDASAL